MRIILLLFYYLGWQPCDGNIFVKYDFSFPHDNHQVGKTKVVYGSNSPGIFFST